MSAPEAGEERGASTPARIAAAGAVIAAFVLVALLLFGGSSGNSYSFLFETGGQLVPGNEVLVAGQPIGTIDSIDLTDDSQAEVKVTTDRTLTEGTTAVIRSTSLSGVANRYLSLTLGPDNAPELDGDQPVSGTDTTSPVDLDQLFNVFRPKAAAGAAEVHPGQCHRLHRQGACREPGLQVHQPGAEPVPAGLRRALPRLGRARALPGRGC